MYQNLGQDDKSLDLSTLPNTEKDLRKQISLKLTVSQAVM